MNIAGIIGILERINRNRKVIVTKALIVFLVLSAGFNLYLFVENLNLKKEVEIIKQKQRFNDNVLAFYKFFIDKVLNPDEDVDFETRLKLESSVRDLNDQQIFDQWQKFTASQNEDEAKKEVKNLLRLLVDKISK